MANQIIELVDVGGGNLGSVRRCLQRMDVSYRIVDESSCPSGEYPLIAPGVGAFGPVMQHLQDNGLAEKLRSLIKGGVPFLGICVGLQILFESSEEAPGVSGLAVLPGKVVKYKEGKVPQIGWNFIHHATIDYRIASPKAPSEQPIELVPQGSNHINQMSECESGYVYFVNSYYACPTVPEHVLYYANYYLPFCAAVKADNVTAFQFHAEKSGKFGQTLLTRWLADVI
jgi:imidazoleglycerol phosphate synthase glutamine amidotransferase subunit HisH